MTKHRSLLAALAILAASLGSLTYVARGQTILGTILGTATDASGAVVPGVSVTIRNQETGIEQHVATHDNGLYEVKNLIRGTYSVTAEQPGFKRFAVSGVLLESAATVRVDLRLATGELSSSIDVHASAPVINTESVDLANARGSETLTRLPLNVRGSFNGYFYDMVKLTPGVVAQSSNNFSFGGTRTYQFTTGVDGIITNSVLFGNSTGTAQSGLDFTQEFRVQLANANAESLTPGGFFATTKSGGNSRHGSLFYYYTGSKLKARNTFSSSVPFGLENNFGGSVGGPIIRNRTFYYVGIERFDGRTEAIMAPSVPTLNMRNGDFSALTDTAIVDPLTGIPFPENKIPTARLSSVALKMQDLFFPLPNTGPADEFQSNWQGVRKNQPFKTQVETRIDHKLSDSNSLYGRISWNRGGTNDWPTELPTIPRLEQQRVTTTLAIGDTHIFSPTLLNEFRFGLMRHHNAYHSPIDGTEVVKKIGLEGLASNVVSPWGMPYMYFDNFTSLASDDNDLAGDYLERTYQAGDSLTWIHGGHTLKAGTDIRRNLGSQYPIESYLAFGVYTFAGEYTGFDYADFLLGIPGSAKRVSSAPMYHLMNTNVSFFLQDDWKVNRHLTLNLGVRYDYNPPYHEQDGRIFNFDPANGRIVVPNENSMKYLSAAFPKDLAQIVTASEAGYPGNLMYSDLNNFTPRIGFAYRPFDSDDTVLRGGYGIYTDYITAQLYDASAVAGPFVSNESFNNELVNGTPRFAFPNAFPSGFGAIGSQDFNAVNPHLRNPYIQQWSFTAERAFKGTGLRVSYIGTSNRQAVWAPNLNQPVPSLTAFDSSLTAFPAFNVVRWETNGGNQTYHSLHVVAEHKARNGLYYQFGWIWAKDLTDALAEGKAVGSPQNSYARYMDRTDVAYVPRHSWTGNLVYDLPFGPGRTWLTGLRGPARHILGGWTVSSILTARTGTFFSPSFSAFDVSNTNTVGGRPDRIANGNLDSSQRSIAHWFDNTAFQVPGDTNGDGRPDVAVGRFGNSAPNVLVGPGLFNLNAGLHKHFRILERLDLVLQGTFTNVLNHANYNNPNANIRSALVGRITSAQAARAGQLAARLEF
jgi:hypothetical protein